MLVWQYCVTGMCGSTWMVLVGVFWVCLAPATVMAMLHPQQGRFMQRDPLTYVDGMGAYAYAIACPVVWIDPSGTRVELVSIHESANIEVVMDDNGKPATTNGRPVRAAVFPDLQENSECDGCTVKLDVVFRLRLSILRRGHSEWQDHEPTYDIKWGKPRTDNRERQAAYAHEMDHWATYAAFWSRVEGPLRAFDGKVFSTPSECWKELRAKMAKVQIYFDEADYHSRTFEFVPWNVGGEYPRHPFVKLPGL